MTCTSEGTVAISLLLSVVGVCAVGCKDAAKISAAQATAHVAFLAETIAKDVEEVRGGLPEGADILAAQWKAQPTLDGDLNAVQSALETARRKVQDLRIAKTTFFALADANGTVLRNDQEQDRMAGKALFASFPALSDAKNRYVETTGSMPEAAGVRAPRADGQWVAASPVRVDGGTRGLYVTGWSWASYAYRLEFALRSQIRSQLASQSDAHEPLLYVFLIVGKSAFGAPVTPDVTAQAVAALDPLAKIKDAETFSSPVEITGRSYGVAVKRAPSLGADIGVAVLRSET